MPLSLATTQGITIVFSSTGYLDVSVPPVPLRTLYIQARTTRHDPCQVHPFGNPRINACLAAPRGISQPATSFIGFQRQGIHRVPLTTCRDDARARYEVPNDHTRTRTAPTPTPTPTNVDTDRGTVRNPNPTGHQPAPLKAAQRATPPTSTEHHGPNPPPPLTGDNQAPPNSIQHRRTAPQPASTGTPPTPQRGRRRSLPRKEVIQPHLPVRLPCYDFVPIAGPTFGSSPQTVRPLTSGVADFHDVTGGVYKARERIHRSVADLRLLATPPSWSRVADSNPN